MAKQLEHLDDRLHAAGGADRRFGGPSPHAPPGAECHGAALSRGFAGGS